MSELSHIVRENGIDYRLKDTEARAMISQLQQQIGNVDLSDLDLKLPENAEFNSVVADEAGFNSITLGEINLTERDFMLFLQFVGYVQPLEGAYF